MTDTIFHLADLESDPPDLGVLKDEQIAALRDASHKLPPHCQRLLRVLMDRGEYSYKQVSELLNMPIGSIGPTRGRCLDHLRQLLAEIEAIEPAITA